MTEEERYLFDLKGYLVIRNALTPEHALLRLQPVLGQRLVARATERQRSLLELQLMSTRA